MKNRKIGALILAAGMSSRMKSFKPLLPIGQDTLIRCVIKRLKEGGAEEIVVVTGNKAHLVEENLEGWSITFVRNEQYERSQMFDSILLGVEKLQGKCEAFFLLPADIPMFLPKTLMKMVKSLESFQSQGVRPIYRGKFGHPILLSESSIDRIQKHNGKNGLRGAVEKLEMIDIAVEDEGILYDADTPDEYKRLCAYRWGSVPTEGEIQEIYHYFDATDDIISHCETVSHAALEICEKLRHEDVNTQQVEAAARLHDAARRLPDHAQQIGRLLRKMGYGRLAEIVEVHMDLPKEAAEVLDERAILYLADKLVVGNRKVTLEQRFARAVEKYGTNEETIKAVSEKMTLAQGINRRIEDDLRRLKK